MEAKVSSKNVRNLLLWNSVQEVRRTMEWAALFNRNYMFLSHKTGSAFRNTQIGRPKNKYSQIRWLHGAIMRLEEFMAITGHSLLQRMWWSSERQFHESQTLLSLMDISLLCNNCCKMIVYKRNRNCSPYFPLFLLKLPWSRCYQV